MRPLKPALSTLLAATAVGLVLTGCRYDGLGARPAASSSPIAWPATTEAPYPQGAQAPRGYYDTVPPPARTPVARLASNDDGWAWAERSYWLDQAFYDTPPDYGFYYDDDQPWVWQTADRWSMYGDPYGDDRYYYYYQPGAVRPYFIRDDRYGYGYDDVGRLVTVISLLTGQMMPQSFLYAQDPYASRYYQRAYLVREASLRADPIVITRDVWLQQQPAIVRTQNIWVQQATTAPAWVQYRQRSGDRELRRFEGARQQRLNTLAAAPQQQQSGWFGRGRDRQSAQGVQTAALSGRQEARMADQLRNVERRQQQDRQDLAKHMPRDQRQQFEAQNRDLQRGEQRDVAQQVRQQAQDQQRLAKAGSVQERRNVERDLAAQARQRGQGQNQQRLAQTEQRDQQRQAEAQSRQQQRDQQRQSEAQGRQQQQQAQRQAEAQSRQQQQQAQRQAEAQSRQQQQQAQRQAEAQSRQQQQQAQRQAEAQSRQQQQQAQRQAEAQSRQQQQQAQRPAESQARQQQAQQAQQAQQQQKAQRQEKAQAKPQQQQQGGQEANAEPGAKGHGRDKKG